MNPNPLSVFRLIVPVVGAIRHPFSTKFASAEYHTFRGGDPAHERGTSSGIQTRAFTTATIMAVGDQRTNILRRDACAISKRAGAIGSVSPDTHRRITQGFGSGSAAG